MLTADLVRARRRGGTLSVTALKGATREEAARVAERYLELAEEHVGRTRQELVDALAEVPVGARARKVADGLRKLVLDRCELEADADVDPVALREEVFLRASAAREALEDGVPFDRQAVLVEVGAQRGLDPATLERSLYADLREQHRLLSFTRIAPEGLVAEYELANEQAILLRAERVEVDVTCTSPAAYRRLFHKLKFLRLLHTIATRPEGGYRVVVDGPFSLFGPVTKYGLSLALLLPTLRELDRYALRAVVRWGKARDRLVVELEGGCGKGRGEVAPVTRTDEVEKLLERFADGKRAWRASPSEEVLSLPGLGQVVPDLVFEHAETGARAYLEVLGYWSRDAVWKRVELVEHGLDTPIVFAVPSRLRVSEAVLDPDLPAALYVFKGVLSPKAIETRLDQLRQRGTGRAGC